ncbi:MAG TPA: methyltransferase domain-containing protein [Rudaea sp.]|nr:methyltransferase domain-containing protein [Rudaea sp.]
MTIIAPAMLAVRRALAEKYLEGNGIEIGALDCPTPAPPNAHVQYVDRVSVAQLRAYYPELADHQLIEPDMIEDGERLPGFASESLDFIIANHMLEHCEDPLGTMRTHFDRIRSKGLLYYAIPDKRQCFDHSRPLTPFAHLVDDNSDGGIKSRWGHYLDWAVHVNGLAELAAAEKNAEENMRNAYSIHFHVWTPKSFLEMLHSAREYLGTPFTIEHFQENGTEALTILRKP